MIKKHFYDTKFDLSLLDEAFSYYNLDEKYKKQACSCFQQILKNEYFMNNFFKVYEILFLDNSDKFKELWKIKDIDVLFGKNTPVFTTNLMVLLGMPIHKEKMKQFRFDNEQIKYHKARVRECFINDLEKRAYKSIRISQMLWASYFINCRIIQVGILEYEYDQYVDKIKIHIPHLPKLNFEEVKKSLADSKSQVRKYFHSHDNQYICNSWLLSKQLAPILDDNSNIKKFQSLFQIEEGEDCVKDILNFVFNLSVCEDYKQLPENSSLQRKIKIELEQGKIFKLGCGRLL